ncbi:MAG: PrgI family protein [Candidatus Cloacimonetes bacterium]|jgi:hypothetical protein|nr:PrgI family protein [Candidatus Cloacimonadota bacterium]
MQQFTVPQFIDVESKIIGPITTRQFLILLGAAIIIAISYKIFDFSLFLVVGFVTLGIAALFAFIKVNARPFHLFVLNILQTSRRPNLRVWNHRVNFIDKKDPAAPINVEPGTTPRKVFKESRLAELSLIVDTKGRYRGE